MEKLTNFLALAGAISVLAGLIEARCPTTVYSPILAKTLDVFSISDRCFFLVLNDYNLPSTSPDERCSVVVHGSVSTIDAKGNYEDNANYVVCEIQQNEIEDTDDDIGVVPVVDDSKLKLATQEEIDTFLKECNIKQIRPKTQCEPMRKMLVRKMGGRLKAQPILTRRRAELVAKKSNLVFPIIGGVIGIIVTLIVSYVVCFTKKKRPHRRRRRHSSTTTNTTTEAAPSKRKKRRKFLRKHRGNDDGDDESNTKSTKTSMAATPSSRSSVSKSTVSKISQIRNVDSEKDDKKSKKRRKKRRH